MARKAKSSGDYDGLSPEVKNLAYGMNKEYNLGQDLAETKARVVEQRASDRDQLSSDLHALKESGVSGDKLLKNYNKAIHNNSDARRVQHFEEMLLLGGRLVPEEFFMVNGEVMAIATPDDDTEEFVPTPLLLELEAHNRSLIYEFVWTVPVAGKEEWVQINSHTTVGKKAIKDALDTDRDDSQLIYLRKARAYEAIGELEDAKRQQTFAVRSALEILGRISSHTGGAERDIADAFEVLIKTGTMDKFMEETALEIAKDRVDNASANAARYSLLHNLLAYRKVQRGECDSVYRARVEFDEIAGLWFVMKARGKALLDLQSDQNGQ